MNRKHLLILGAGASMSLIPKEIIDNNDVNDDKRMLSGYDLVQYIANYSKKIFLMILSIQYGRTYGDNIHEIYEMYHLLSEYWDFSECG